MIRVFTCFVVAKGEGASIQYKVQLADVECSGSRNVLVSIDILSVAVQGSSHSSVADMEDALSLSTLRMLSLCRADYINRLQSDL